MVIFTAVLCWVAAITRVVMSVRGPMLLWRWAFTITIVSSAVAMSALAWQTKLDQMTTPNLAVLILEEAFVVSVGSTLIYLLTLLYETAPSSGMRSIIAVIAIIEIAILGCWLAAPVHSVELDNIYVYGISVPSVQAFAVLFFATVICELVAASLFTIHLTRTIHAADPTGRVGGWLVASSTAIGAVVLLIAACLMFVRPDSPSTNIALAEVLGAICVLVVIGIMTGSIVMVGGPRLLRLRSQRRYALQLRPLWLGLTDLFPVITLSVEPRTPQRTTSSINLERMLIEVHDGLDLLLVKTGTRLLSDVAAQIASPGGECPRASLIPASTVLYPMTNEKEERELLCALAEHYSRRRSGSFDAKEAELDIL